MTFALTNEQAADAYRIANEEDLPNFSLAGTGKTHTYLEAVRIAKPTKTLLLCPKIALSWWHNQAQEWGNLDSCLIKAGKDPIGGEFVVTTYDIVKNNREKFHEYFAKGENMCGMDESHAVVNPDSARTQALYGFDGCFTGAALLKKFANVTPMTGTPKMNYQDDYYTQVAALHPWAFEHLDIDGYDSFRQRFCIQRLKSYHPKMPKQMKVVADTNQVLLQQILYKKIGIIRRKTIEGLPDMLYRTLEVEFKLDKSYRDAAKGLSAAQIAAALADSNSVISQLWRFTGLGKIKQLLPYIGESSRSSPILVGCWHREVMQTYYDGLTKMGLKVEQVHGGVSVVKAEKIRTDFNAGKIDVLLGQIRKMGVSWNIQESCRHVIMAEQVPTPALEEQFYKRVYRRGQKNAVIVDNIVATNNPVDRAFVELRASKTKSDDKVHSTNKSAYDVLYGSGE